jgi:ABC-type branched-subunit amino acid transport system ATPase component
VTAALETKSLVKRFGGLVATNDVTMALPRGARHALIGPNGAGKTTFVNLLSGALAPTNGRVLLDGVDVTRWPMHRRARAGLSRTFQINRLFADFTPLETIVLVLSERDGQGARWWDRPPVQGPLADEAMALLRNLGLAEVAGGRVASLPYGQQRLLEIAIALAPKPAVLLLDEPAAGVPEGERDRILDAVDALPRDMTILLIEHDMDLVFRFARTISVLVNGALFVEGPADRIAADPRVKQVYLGEAWDAPAGADHG